MNAIPSFIICGAERCGTTWCWRTLQAHPDICMSHPKESDFFGAEFSRGEKWYRGLFSDPDAPITGDITPWYWNDEDSIRRIAELSTPPQVILVLRNPEHRAISHWMLVHAAEKGDLSAADLEGLEALTPESKFVQRSMYGRLWERLTRWIPEDRVTVLIYEELSRDSQSFRRNLFSAVGADPERASEVVEKRVNPSAGYRFPRLFRSMRGVSRFCARTPGLAMMRRWVHERTTLRERVLESMVKDDDVRGGHQPVDRIPERTRALLREDLQKFIELSGIDLPEEWADGISTSSKS